VNSIVFKILVLCLVITVSMHAQFIRDDVKEIVIDSSRGLVWMDNIVAAKPYSLNYFESEEYCVSYKELVGSGTWDLPTIYEYTGIHEGTNKNFMVNEFTNGHDSFGPWMKYSSIDSKYYRRSISSILSIGYNTDPYESEYNPRCVSNNYLIENSFDFKSIDSIHKQNIFDEEALYKLQTLEINATNYDVHVPFSKYTLLSGNNDSFQRAGNTIEVLQNDLVVMELSDENASYLKSYNLVTTSGAKAVNSYAYLSNPQMIEMDITYADVLTDINKYSKVRYFSFADNDSNLSKRYRLVVSSQEGFGSLIKIDDSKDAYIILTLYKNGEAVGSEKIIASDSIYRDFVLNLSQNYTFSIDTQNIEEFSYVIALLNNHYLYDETMQSDENGEVTFNFVLPDQDTYGIYVFDKDANFSIENLRSRKMIVNNESLYQIKPMSAGSYTLKIASKPNSDIQFIIARSVTKKELEPSNSVSSAVDYIPQTRGEFDANDSDFYKFKIDTDKFVNIDIDFENTNQNSFYYKVYNATGELVNKKTVVSEATQSLQLLKGFYILELSAKALVDEKVPYTLTLGFDGETAKLPRYYSSESEQFSELYTAFVTNGGSSVNLKEIDLTKASSIGSLIILTGDSDNETDPLYNASQKLSQKIYNTFLYRGLSSDQIYWHNFNNEIDIDNDGVFDDIVDNSTISVTKFKESITTWATNQDTFGPLYIYMVDHGSNGAFKISNKDYDNDSKSEILYASELKNAIDSFQSQTNREVVIIIEACKSGSFIDQFEGSSNVTILTSSLAGELSYIESFGTIAFSTVISRNILSGKSIKTSFDDATETLLNYGAPYNMQTPQFFSSSENIQSHYVGGNFAAASMSLTDIVSFSVNGAKQTGSQIDLQNNATVNFEAQINNGSSIENVYVTSIDPNYNPDASADFFAPDISLKNTVLTYNEVSDTYSGSFTFESSQLLCDGTYTFTMIVEDSDGFSVSKTLILQADTPSDAICSTSANSNNNQPIYTENSFSDISLSHALELSIPIHGFVDPDGEKLSYSAVISFNDNTIVLPINNDAIVIPSNLSDGSYTVTITAKDGSFSQAQTSFNIQIGESNVVSNEYKLLQDISFVNSLSGWHLLGNGNAISVNDIVSKKSNINTIWTYDYGWRAYSSDTTIQEILNNANIPTVETIEQGQGFWINLK